MGFALFLAFQKMGSIVDAAKPLLDSRTSLSSSEI
jgi:hypothetical protein